MGSFNVSCGVSRLSIGPGTPMVLIPLVPVDTKWSDRYVGAFVVSNEGPRAANVPFTLPIFGEYNDYGTLENVEEDENTEAIEKFFGCSIGDFVDHVCRPWDADSKIGNENMPKKPLGMFVHRKVYDWMANNHQSEYDTDKNTSYNQSYVSAYLLKLCDFVEGEKSPDNSKRYNRPFKHPEIEGLTIWSDGTWIEVEMNNKKVDSWIYNPEDLVQFLKKQSLNVPEILYHFLDVPYYAHEYDKELEKLKRAQESNAGMIESFKKIGTKTEQEISEMIEALSFMEDAYGIFTFGGRYSKNDTFKKLYGESFDNPSIKDMIVKFRTFEHSLYGVNAAYLPSWNGYQCGNHRASYGLAKVVQGILEEGFNEDKKNAISDWWFGVKYNTKRIYNKWFSKKKEDKEDDE